jgi:hypothetical protein
LAGLKSFIALKGAMSQALILAKTDRLRAFDLLKATDQKSGQLARQAWDIKTG